MNKIWQKMAEKSYFQTAQSNFLCVIVNFNNLRFMTLVKDNALISDLIKEIEKTYSKLCSAKVKIKMLKNSVNAVLPSWYPVVPLIRNQDEIYAFSDDATVVTPTISPSASLLRTDSGFTSLLTKPGTSGERDGSPEILRVNEGCQGQQLNNSPGRNVSQDEGNELLSEIFSLKGQTPKKDEETSVKGNIQSKRIIPDDSKNLKETKDLSRKGDVGLGVESSSVEGMKLKKAKDTAVVLQEKAASSCDSSDESSWETDDSSEKAEKDKKDLTKPTDSGKNKASQQHKPFEKHQNKTNSIQTLQVKRKSSSQTKIKSFKNNIPVEKGHKSDSSVASSDDKSIDKYLENNKSSVVNRNAAKSRSPLTKPEEASGDKSETLKDRKSNSAEASGKKGKTLFSGLKIQFRNKKGNDEDSSSSSSSSDSSDDSSSSDSDFEEEDNLKKAKADVEKQKEVPSVEKGGNKNKNYGISESSWTTSEDERDVTNKTMAESKNQTKQNDDLKDCVDGGKRESRANEKPTSGHKKMEENMMNSKEEDGVRTDEKDKETNLKTAPSPAKSVRNKKSNEVVTTKVTTSPANTKTRGKKNASAKNVADQSKSDKRKDTEVEAQSDSESSDSTLEPSFTQLPAKGKIKTSDVTDENAAKKGEGIMKTPKKKRKHNSTDEEKDGDQDQPTDSNVWSSQTPSKSQKSSVMSSASKVASWLLSNPELDAIDDAVPSQESPNKKKHSKNKSNVEASSGEVKDAHKSKSESKNKTSEESTVNEMESRKTKGKNEAQKRKVEDNSKEKLGNKKNKKNVDEKNDKQQIEEKTQDEQENTSTKSEKSTKGKTMLLSLPKVSKGLSALMEDESDYSRKTRSKGKKPKLAPPTVTRKVTQTGFLTPSSGVARKTSGSKTPKSRIKKIPSSQPSKVIELNTKEKEFLDSGALNLETLLKDESIKW